MLDLFLGSGKGEEKRYVKKHPKYLAGRWEGTLITSGSETRAVTP